MELSDGTHLMTKLNCGKTALWFCHQLQRLVRRLSYKADGQRDDVAGLIAAPILKVSIVRPIERTVEPRPLAAHLVCRGIDETR